MAMPIFNKNMKLFFSYCLLILLSACSIVSEDDLNKLKPYEGPMSRAYNLETRYSDSARLRVSLKAALQEEYKGGDQEFPKGILIFVYDKEGRKTTRLTANRGRYIKKKNKYVAIGNVVVVNLLKNEELRTEELHWTPTDRQIFTDERVTIKTPNELIKGTALKADESFTRYTIYKPDGTIKVKK